MSRDPSNNGQRKLLKPVRTGEAYRKIMLTPWNREELVVLSGAEDGLIRRAELQAHHQRLDSPQDQEREGGDDVADADFFMVDGGEPALPTRLRPPYALQPGPRLVTGDRRHLRAALAVPVAAPPRGHRRRSR